MQILTLKPDKVVVFIIAANVLVELILQIADNGLLGTTLWRGTAYHNGAFWPGLLGNWKPNYTIQPVTMFFSYSWLHVGAGHLLGNVATLYVLGILLKGRLSPLCFVFVYVVSATAGGLGFFLLGDSFQPMVGASGAIFGLAGVWVVWEFSNRRQTRHSTRWIWGEALGLFLINIVFWYVLDGVLAWEAHLGGFIGGAIATLMCPQRRLESG